MNILDRFSTHLKEILARAMQTAAELKNEKVEPLHLFYAAMNEKGSMAAELIKRCKPDIKILEQMLLALPASENKEKIKERKISELQLPILSPQAKLALEKALIIAQQNTHNYLGSEHLLAALIDLENEKLKECFKLIKFPTEKIREEINAILNNAAQFPNIQEMAEAAEQIQEDFLGLTPPPAHHKRSGSKYGKQESALQYFAIDLTEAKNQKNIDPVIGRENEIERLTQILSRRTKNNPVLLGDPGVGKTAIVEGLAKRIAEGKAPDSLRNKKVFSVDLGLLVAGTIYRGEFEARLKELIDDASRDPNIILFIDEIHNIVGAGSSQGSMDAANMLKPALARGTIHCIGSTTPAEYKKFIESDAALERRLMPVMVREPSVRETIEILRGIKNNYENFHQVNIEEGAVRAAAEMSDRYIAGKFLPDKAIDLLDETAAAKRLTVKNEGPEKEIADLRTRLREISGKKEEAAVSNRLGEAIKMQEDEKRIIEQIGQLKNLPKNENKKLCTVKAEDVAQQVARIIGRQTSEIIIGQEQKFSKIAADLKKSVIGQDEAIDKTVALIRQAELGLSDPERPAASLLYVGPSGTGKTELAKILAQTLYPGQDALIKLDMSEFGEAFGASKLLGSPAGYVGYKESNQFTDKLKLQPYSVVLFDEIDKAHPDILKLLLQMLEEGQITDATGKKISLKHAIIILTTSFASDELKKGSFGFSHSAIANKENMEHLQEKLKERFSAELINRLDGVCCFNELMPTDLAKIAIMEINFLNQRLKKYSTKITVMKKDLEKLVAELDGKQNNARDIRQKIRLEIEREIAELILKGQPKKTYTLRNKDKKMTLA